MLHPVDTQPAGKLSAQAGSAPAAVFLLTGEDIKKAIAPMADNTIALPSIAMCTHDSTRRKAVLVGWLASQSDMLADDWEIVNE